MLQLSVLSFSLTIYFVVFWIHRVKSVANKWNCDPPCPLFWKMRKVFLSLRRAVEPALIFHLSTDGSKSESARVKQASITWTLMIFQVLFQSSSLLTPLCEQWTAWLMSQCKCLWAARTCWFYNWEWFHSKRRETAQQLGSEPSQMSVMINREARKKEIQDKFQQWEWKWHLVERTRKRIPWILTKLIIFFAPVFLFLHLQWDSSPISLNWAWHRCIAAFKLWKMKWKSRCNHDLKFKLIRSITFFQQSREENCISHVVVVVITFTFRVASVHLSTFGLRWCFPVQSESTLSSFS